MMNILKMFDARNSTLKPYNTGIHYNALGLLLIIMGISLKINTPKLFV